MYVKYICVSSHIYKHYLLYTGIKMHLQCSYQIYRYAHS